MNIFEFLKWFIDEHPGLFALTVIVVFGSIGSIFHFNSKD